MSTLSKILSNLKSQNPTTCFYSSFHFISSPTPTIQGIEMAYAAVASVSETIDIILKFHKPSISPQFELQMKSLQKHSLFFRSFLDDFRERGNNWDETIREVSDRAEEIIELLLSDLFILETTTAAASSSSYSSSGDLERVTEEMESIINRVNGKDAEAARGADDDEELMEIISRLREGSSSREVIAIVGMLGMGKAALAKKAYHHPLIVQHFKIRAWSNLLSQEYSRDRGISELLHCLKTEPDQPETQTETEAESGVSSDSRNEIMIGKILHRRRYLIVLTSDNIMWSVYTWDWLKNILPDNENGSRIILTTRSTDSGRDAGASYVHEMRFLDVDKTWDLVRHKVFKRDPCPPQLEPVGKVIARSCGGHPLCVQVVSGILAAADQTLAAWEHISESMNTIIKVNGNEEDVQIMKSIFMLLSLSYMYLPHHLKPCFLYFGCFIKDEEIRVSKLIKLWLAEGFLNETDQCEDIGEEYVQDLVRRGLVSVIKWKSSCSSSNGGRRRIKSVSIHSYMRDSCLRQAHIDKFNYDAHRRSVDVVRLLSCRRVSTSYDNRNNFYDLVEGVYDSTIRTIILSSDATRFGFIRWSIPNLRLLRILDLLNVYYDDLNDHVFELFHLRYLAFCSWFGISQAISNLQNLQTLIIRSRKNDSGMIDDFPDGIWRMPQLQHLYILHFKLPTAAHDQILGATSALEDLQTLSGVVSFICSRDNLKMIPNLKKMALFYTTDVVQEDYELHNLIYLHKLQILKIEFDIPFQHMMTSCAFQFPQTLKKLNLCGSVGLPWEDMKKIVASLPNLQVLKLRRYACIGDTWETSEGGFSRLIYLLIEDSNLKNWKTGTSHFPKLKHLVLRGCPSLLEVPSDIGKIPTLELIELDEENRSLLSSANRIQKDQQSSGDDRLQIHVV